MVVAQFVFVFIQYIKLKSGVGYFLPVEWYIQNSATLPDELDLMWSPIRPSGTFGEPSYLGFISASLLMAVAHCVSNNYYKSLLISVLLATVILAQTLAGVLTVFILLFLYLWQISSNRTDRKLQLISLVFVALLVVLMFDYSDVLTRLANITNESEELSGYHRIVVPLKVIFKVFTSAPYGVPETELLNFLINQKSDLVIKSNLANGFFNVLINYGIFGVIILYILFNKARFSIILLAYLFLASMFNGSIFSYDKAVVISLTVLMMLIGLNDKSTRDLNT
jgi:hypothetical protein